MPDFLTGVNVIAILCWPTARETAGFHEGVEALASRVIRRTLMGEPHRADEMRRDYPVLVDVSYQLSLMFTHAPMSAVRWT